MKAPNFRVASFCVTERAKATLDFVYSWPGYDGISSFLSCRSGADTLGVGLPT